MERLILLCFVLGLSTRKVAEALVPILGEGVSASTVSRVARTLDRAAAAFHGRALKRRYRFLILDGWEGFLSSLYRRGLTGEGLELIITDGGELGFWPRCRSSTQGCPSSVAGSIRPETCSAT